MAALGDSFEYVGDEAGRTRLEIDARFGVGNRLGRFWFAKVRPKKPGEFAVACSINYDFRADPKKRIWLSERTVFTIPIIVGERGAPRVVCFHSDWCGSSFPHANVGDTLLIPIDVDRFLHEHSFAAVDKTDSSVTWKFGAARQNRHEDYLNHRSAKPVVTNEVPEMLDLLASWGSSVTTRSGIRIDSVLAYLEFKRPGEFKLAGRPADSHEKAKGGGVPIRVLPKAQPVTVLLQCVCFKENIKTDDVTMAYNVPAGTIEARVGDRVVLSCGTYRTPAHERQGDYRPGVVVTKPFKTIDSYTLETKK